MGMVLLKSGVHAELIEKTNFLKRKYPDKKIDHSVTIAAALKSFKGVL